MTDMWTDRLSEYVDGELPERERGALEAHLSACPECSALAGELREVKRRAAALADRPPEANLWEGVAARLTPRRGAASRSRAAGAAGRRSRAPAFSLPQLAAAVLASLLVGGGAVWLAVRPAAGPVAGEGAVRPAALLVESPEGEAPGAWEAAIRELERQLYENAGSLDPATVRTIEASLATIDRAIRQARSALERDPGNPYLSRHLNQALARKVDVLRRATALSQS